MAKKFATKSNRPTVAAPAAPVAVPTVVVTPTPSRASTPSPVVASGPRPVRRATHDEVSKRTFELWVAKGRPHGKDLENWQQAERELNKA